MKTEIIDKGFTNAVYTFAIVREERNPELIEGYNKEETKDIIITYTDRMVLPSGMKINFDYLQNAIKAINVANGNKNNKEHWKDAVYYTKENKVVIVAYSVYYIIIAPLVEE